MDNSVVLETTKKERNRKQHCYIKRHGVDPQCRRGSDEPSLAHV